MTINILNGDCKKVLKELEYAYCAGIIDADGTIGIKKSTYSMRVIGDSKNPTYSERICVKQVQSEAVDLLKVTFGGSYHITKPSLVNGRPLFTWCVTDKKAAVCLEKILPYLRIKKQQAANCLLLRERKEQSKKERMSKGRCHVGASNRTFDLTEKMNDLFLNAKLLNKVGVIEHEH